MIKRVAIRANGGPGIGSGHITRCLALAAALAKNGVHVLLLANPESEVDATSGLPGITVISVPAGEATDLRQTRDLIASHGVGALVVDSYDVSSGSLSEISIPVAAIVDAPPPVALPVALLVNGSANADKLPHSLRPGARVLRGPSFVMLSPSFDSVPPREASRNVERVLVTTGGGDAADVSRIFLRSARAAIPDADVTVAVGPYYSSGVLEQLEEMCETDDRIRLSVSPPTLRPLMDTADIAVTAGGQTAYELAATGTPACAVSVAANQRANLQGLSLAGALWWVGDAEDEFLEHRLASTLSRLAQNHDHRTAMSRAGQEVIDSQGAHRVAAAVLGLLR